MQVTYRPNAYGSYGTYHVYPSGEHYAAVDDVSSDDSGTYVYTQSPDEPAHFVTFNFPNPVERGIINYVTVYTRGQGFLSGGAFDGSFYVALYLPGYSPIMGNRFVGPSAWTTLSNTYYTNPWTSAPWSWSDLNSLQIGAYYGVYGGTSQERITQVYIVIDYTPIAAGQHRIIGMMM